MKKILKPLFTILIFGSAFFIGYYLGEEKLKTKIPDFQEDER